MKGKGFALVTAGAVLFGAAVPASAGIGDVIGSFRMDSALNIYRDANYVYCVVGTNTLRRYTAGGSLVGTVSLAGLTNAGDADHSVLGPGYLTVIEGTEQLYEYRIANGSFVRARPALPNTVGYAYFPGGLYYYLRVSMSIYRYTTAGSFVNSFVLPWASSGSIAATDRVNDTAGDYVVVNVGGMTRVFTGTGSAVTAFRVPGTLDGCACGPGTPYTPKTTYWCNLAFGADRFAYEIDLGNKNIAVATTSFGKIKGLYR